MTVEHSFATQLKTDKALAFVHLLGRQLPTEDDVHRAQRILQAAPLGASPLDVARYFAGLQDVNADGDSMIAEWPRRANPVITTFLAQATSIPPQDIRGDQTAWCAAFVNWCMQRAGKHGTRSVSSGSFRCEGIEAAIPAAGDVAVFKNQGEDAKCSGQGHVGFFIRRDQLGVTVLGGNQSNRISEHHFAADVYPKLVSIRSMASLK